MGSAFATCPIIAPLLLEYYILICTLIVFTQSGKVPYTYSSIAHERSHTLYQYYLY